MSYKISRRDRVRSSTDNFLLKISSRSHRRARKSLADPTPSLDSFRSVVWKYWREKGRHGLPWRKTRNPYGILVSEVMLQQTQVSRVAPKYREFLKKFPTVDKLARSHLATVLKAWNGLGYNRRGKFLRDAAKIIMEKHDGRIPRSYDELCALPGVGDYTARAIRVFAWNEPDILIETNIRTVLIHCFFMRKHDTIIYDSKLLPLARKAAEEQDPREWHWALMDYGAYLKRSGVRNNHRSVHHTKQSKFEGSLRQIRGEILRKLTSGEFVQNRRYTKALTSLVRDGLVVCEEGEWQVA